MVHESKRIKKLAFLALISGSFLTACGSNLVESKDNSITITFVEDPNIYFNETQIKAKKGDDVKVYIKFYKEHQFNGCDYSNYSFNSTTSVLTLKNVRYPGRVRVTSRINDCEITYLGNGGVLNDGGDTYSKRYLRTRHSRINLSQGGDFSRPGYIQIGWNTSSDGDGEQVGLGSRTSMTVLEKTFYAQWEKVNPSTDFVYEMMEDGNISLLEYIGKIDDKTVIPEIIDGSKVVKIGQGFIKDVTFNNLYLPASIKTIDDDAFLNCRIENLTFFDTLMDVSDASFNSSIVKTMHINAGQAPVYQDDLPHVQFADDIDRLILNQGRKKMVFFAGCSMSYGLVSPKVEEAFNYEYLAANCGVIGGTNALCQFDMLLPYLEKDDVFIHAPEIASSYQLLHDISSEYRMFTLVEGNYDIWSHVDCSKLSGIFDSFYKYNDARKILLPCSYDDVNRLFNSYGDYAIERPFANYENKALTKAGYHYKSSFYSQESKDRLNEVYKRMSDKGVDTFFTFSPVNYQGLNETEIACKAWDIYAEHWISSLDRKAVKVFGNAADYVLSGKYFYDEDYHLTDEGAILRTELLIRDFKAMRNDPTEKENEYAER